MDGSKNWTTFLPANISDIPARRVVASVTSFAGVRIFIVASAFCLNTCLLITHIRKPAYINHFTVYLLFLYISNTIYLAGTSPLIYLSEVYRIDVSSYGLTHCMVLAYFHYVISLIPVMGHLLIAVNRLWAVRFPHHYRVYHTKKVAWLMCIGMALYVHIMKLPPYVLYKPMPYRTTPTSPHLCTTVPAPNGFFIWARVDSFVNRFVPMFAIMLIYAYVMYKRLQRKRKVTAVADNLNNPPKQNETLSVTGDVPHASERVNRGRQNVVRPFLILTFTTISVVTCWMPMAVTSVYHWFLGPKVPPAVVIAVEYSLLMYTLQTLLDPLMWIFGLQKVGNRRRVCSIFCK